MLNSVRFRGLEAKHRRQGRRCLQTTRYTSPRPRKPPLGKTTIQLGDSAGSDGWTQG